MRMYEKSEQNLVGDSYVVLHAVAVVYVFTPNVVLIYT